MQLVFGLAAIEGVVLLLLVLPYAPDFLVRGILAFLFAVRWWSQRLFVAVFAAFGYQVHKMLNAQSMAKEAKSVDSSTGQHRLHELMEHKFRTERNFYLFLFAVTMYVLILRLEFVMKDRLDSRQETKLLKDENADLKKKLASAQAASKKDS